VREVIINMRMPFSLFVVAGDSMLPSLRPGDCLVLSRRARIAVGDVVVARRPHVEGLLLSRAFGVLPDACVVGKVLFRYYPWRRRG
jgi:signal peptidase I